MPDTVTINARIAPAGAVVQEFGRSLLLDTVSAVVTEQDRARDIRRGVVLAAASDLSDFAVSDEAAAGARVYFQQDPYPRNLVIGTRVGAAQPALIFGGESITAQAAIQGLGDDVAFSLGGNDLQVDFAALADLTAVAAAFANAINALAAFNAVAVTVDNGTLVVNVPPDVSEAVGDGFADSAASQALGLDPDTAELLDGIEDAETPVEALDRIRMTEQFYWVGGVPSLSKSGTAFDDLSSIGGWAGANRGFAALDLYGADALVANEAASVGARISVLGQNSVLGIWNGGDVDHKGLGLAGIFSSVDFEGARTAITGKFKTIQGTAATALTRSQRDELTRKRINYMAPRPGQTIGRVAEGESFGTWIDVQYFIDWFTNALEVGAFNALAESGRVPQTEEGVSSIFGALTAVCEQAVLNGNLAPNNVTPQTAAEIRRVTGNRDFDGFLSTGYLVWAGSLADQPQSDRAARDAPPFQVWSKGSGAMHFLDINVLFEQ